MLPEIGTFAIILSLCFAMIQWLTFIINPRSKIKFLLETSVIGQFLFLAFAMVCLMGCFIANDLTVVFVREHSHRLLPLIYRIGAAWGGHEGSLLLWCLVLSGWTLIFAFFWC